jgi:hypothetical protein
MYAEMLFAARFTVDAAAGTIDVVATPDECEAALGMLKPYWFAQNEELRANDGLPPLMKRQLTAANDLERRSDAERISATCRAAGHYVLGRDGRLGKIRK